MDKVTKLQAIYDQIIANGVCPELAESATQLVRGHGNVDAKLVFIGEAPGRKEDEGGQPFVGASGKLLNELLASIGLERSDVYITNIVKYRPPNNRDPKPAEKAAFLPYLQQELAVIQPTVVATLGRHSLNCFLPQVKISECHGIVQESDLPCVLLPLYHPAAALYNGSMRQTLFDDFQNIKQFL